MTHELARFYDHSHRLLRPYGGQLTPEFQRRLQAGYAGVTPEECHFYHTLDLGQGRIVPGGWDLRGSERNYLGHVEFAGRSVLEFGPASGYLSFWMEENGAAVTVFDLPPEYPPDLLPLPGVDLDANAKSGAETAAQVRNSWWYAHRSRQSGNRAVYGDIYRLPPDMGRYDISTFGSILLHLSNPFLALREAARVTDQAIIVTDLLPEIIYGTEQDGFLEFNPGSEPRNLVNWWRLSPGSTAKMLRMLGFPFVDIHYFQVEYHPFHKPELPPLKRFMFCAVGQREAGQLPRLAKGAAEMAVDDALRAQVPVLHAEHYNDAHRRLRQAAEQVDAMHARLKDAHATLERIYRSFAWKLTKPIRMLTRNG
jgi:hypothetical protein